MRPNREYTHSISSSYPAPRFTLSPSTIASPQLVFLLRKTDIIFFLEKSYFITCKLYPRVSIHTNNMHLPCGRFYYGYKINLHRTSHQGTTSEKRTKALIPKCPLFEGSTVHLLRCICKNWGVYPKLISSKRAIWFVHLVQLSYKYV